MISKLGDAQSHFHVAAGAALLAVEAAAFSVGDAGQSCGETAERSGRALCPHSGHVRKMAAVQCDHPAFDVVKRVTAWRP